MCYCNLLFFLIVLQITPCESLFLLRLLHYVFLIIFEFENVISLRRGKTKRSTGPWASLPLLRALLGELPAPALLPQGRTCHPAVPHPGAERDPWLPSLPHEAGPARPAPGGPDPRRPVRERSVPVRARLFHPAEAPEDHRGGAGHHCHASSVRVHGAGGLWGTWVGEASQLSASKSSQRPSCQSGVGVQEEMKGQGVEGGDEFSLTQVYWAMISEALRSFTHCRSSACIRSGNWDVFPPEKTTGTPSFPILSAVCRAPGQDGGLRERGDCRVPLQPGWQLPLLGAESPPAGGTSLHGNDRGCQPACCPAAGKETGSEPCGGFCLELGVGVSYPA